MPTTCWLHFALWIAVSHYMDCYEMWTFLRTDGIVTSPCLRVFFYLVVVLKDRLYKMPKRMACIEIIYHLCADQSIGRRDSSHHVHESLTSAKTVRLGMIATTCVPSLLPSKHGRLSPNIYKVFTPRIAWCALR